MIDTTSLPASVPVKQIDAKCEEYSSSIDAWTDVDLLCRGGKELRKMAQRFLVKRPKELPEVYSSRINRFTYQNILGTCLGWYQSATFKDDPEINFRRGGAVVDADNEEDFFTQFAADCDRGGTTFLDFWRDKVFPDLLKFGSAYVLTDLPAITAEFATLAEQKSAGALDPYLISYSPLQVINWDTDAYGNLLWIVIYAKTEARSFAKDAQIVDRWYYFDRTMYAIYEADRKDSNAKAEVATLKDSGRHALADKNRVPVRRFCLPEEMNLGDRVYLHVLSHLNMQNAYYWGLTMGCLPQLYIKGDYEEPPSISETSYHAIAADGDIGYIEPAGTCYEIASKEISAVRGEIYRQLYLIAQGKDSSATASAQSGYSKEQDMAPSRDVLNGFGKILRAGIVSVGGDVADAHGDDATVEVIGFDFEDDDTDGDIATAQLATDLDIPSDTLDKEIKKEIARKLLKGRRPEVIKTVEDEIDAAPTKSEVAAQQQQDQQTRMRQALDTSLNKQTNRQALQEA